jgi:hypothetical protein
MRESAIDTTAFDFFFAFCQKNMQPVETFRPECSLHCDTERVKTWLETQQCAEICHNAFSLEFREDFLA